MAPPFSASVPRFFDGVICERAGMDVSCSAKAVIIKAGAGEERNGWIRQAHAACAFSRGPVAFTVVGRSGPDGGASAVGSGGRVDCFGRPLIPWAVWC
jgi:hypothetical protein